MSTRAGIEGQSGRRAEELFVVLAWLWCAAVLVTFVVRHAATLPFADDVLMARYVDPGRALDGGLLWAQHNEHRIPLPKLVYVWTVGGLHDLRAGIWLQAALLLGVSGLLLAALRRRAGGLRASDAVLALLLLSVGNTENLLNSFQLAFALPALLSALLLWMALRLPARTAWRRIGALWLILLLLAACGSAGLIQAVVLALWPLALGWKAWRARAAGWRTALAASALGALALASYVACYFPGFEHLPGFEAPAAGRLAAVALEFLTGGLGANAAPLWPCTGVLVALLLAAGAGLLARELREPEQRGTAALLALQLAAALALALSIGYGRGSDGPEAGFSNRYVVLAAVPLCVLYVSLRVLGRSAWTALAGWVLFAAALANFSADYEYAFGQGHARALIVRRFEKAAREGAGVRELAHGAWSSFFYSEASFAELLEEWRRAGFLDQVLPGERASEPTRSVASGPALALRRVGERELLVAPGAARLEFDVPAGARHFQARVELDPRGAHPRLHVCLELRGGASAQPLFERQLGPGAVAEIDVELPEARPATLVLQLDAQGSRALGLLSEVGFR